MPADPPEGIALLQWALPRLGLRWEGFRKPRRQVLKRIERRRRALGLDDLTSYRAYLDTHPEEWRSLESLCRVTISRFHRDRGVFQDLRTHVLPALARLTQGRPVRCWSAGCGSGEEPYTLALSERFERLGTELSIIATDAEAHLIGRARHARYPRGALKELPRAWVDQAFEPSGAEMQLDPAVARRVRFEQWDLRRDDWPEGPFELVLCRNLAFTYFDEAGQQHVLDGIANRLVRGGALVVGAHEALPEDPRFERWFRSIDRRA